MNPPPPKTNLWQAGDLAPRDGRWFATADRSIGDAWGLLAPVKRTDAGWEVAAQPGIVFMLANIVVDEWRELRLSSGGQDAQRYLCLLRYDHPADRPGSTFLTAFEAGRGRGEEADTVTAFAPAGPENAASVDEVNAALHMLWRQHGAALENRMVSGAPPALLQARAAPPQSLRFVFASCQYPAGWMDRQEANRSYAALARSFEEGEPLPERILLLGDQVYTDATYGLLDPARLDDRYRLPYEQLFAPDGPIGQLPQDLRGRMRMTPDDHEIVDNWEPWGRRATGERHRRGLAAYWHFQRNENAPLDHVWMTSAEPGWHLFMADSRSTRGFRNEETLASATLLGDEQTDALESWLRGAPPGDLKIVTTAAMLLPRLRVDGDQPMRLDNWQGYPASFHRMLAFACDEQLQNLVFLGGDAHLGCAAQVTVCNAAAKKWVRFGCHHAPALYAPYPFANETPWNLRLQDTFSFSWQGKNYTCTVDASVFGDQQTGWGVLDAQRDGAGWKTGVRFLAPATRSARPAPQPCTPPPSGSASPAPGRSPAGAS